MYKTYSDRDHTISERDLSNLGTINIARKTYKRKARSSSNMRRRRSQMRRRRS